MTKLMNILISLDHAGPASVVDLSEDVHGHAEPGGLKSIRQLIQKLQYKGWEIRFDGQGFRLSEEHFTLLKEARRCRSLWKQIEADGRSCYSPDALGRELEQHIDTTVAMQRIAG